MIRIILLVFGAIVFAAMAFFKQTAWGEIILLPLGLLAWILAELLSGVGPPLVINRSTAPPA